MAVLLLAGAIVSSSVTLDLFSQDPAFDPPGRLVVDGLLCLIVLPLALRRRFPLAVLTIGTAAFIPLGIALKPGVEQTFTAVVLSFAFYSAGAYCQTRWR